MNQMFFWRSLILHSLIRKLMQMQILLIEDEVNVVSFIRKGLEEQSYNVEVAYDGKMGLKMALEKEYDLILLDVILPGMNGLEVCKEIRSRKNIPILMLTALGSTDDVVNGLDNGADDYLRKPFKFQELLARIRALLRRKFDPEINSISEIGGLEVNHRNKSVKRNGIPIKLTAREFYLLHYFLKNKGVLVSRADIAETIWDSSFGNGSNVVDVYVNYLRNKIDKNFNPKLIHTVYGMGYIFREETD